MDLCMYLHVKTDEHIGEAIRRATRRPRHQRNTEQTNARILGHWESQNIVIEAYRALHHLL